MAFQARKQRPVLDSAHPTFLGPNDWRLVDRNGTFLKRSGRSLSFPDAASALEYLSSHSIPLLQPWRAPT